MLTDVHPKLPMRKKAATLSFYNILGFEQVGNSDFEGYLMLQKDRIQIHFFEFRELNPADNYGQVYIRTHDIENLYQALIAKKVAIHPNGRLEAKPWGQKEFSILDPDNNLLTFGEAVGF
jgi:catechol 2,3-dioxygenase-like lactoylglutathione lyase family enzyme